MQILPGGIRMVSIPATAGLAQLSQPDAGGDPSGSPSDASTGGAAAGLGALGIIGIGIALLFGIRGSVVESPPPPQTTAVTAPSTAAPTPALVETQTSTTLNAPSSPNQFPRTLKVKAE